MTQPSTWCATNPQQEHLVNAMVDPSRDVDDCLRPLLEQQGAGSSLLESTETAAILALRGFLAHDILKLCLKQRHRVQFGVSR
jgi:hypothetical protein